MREREREKMKLYTYIDIYAGSAGFKEGKNNKSNQRNTA